MSPVQDNSIPAAVHIRYTVGNRQADHVRVGAADAGDESRPSPDERRYLAKPVEWKGNREYRPSMKLSGQKCDIGVASRFLAQGN